ncbi:hypothetical protein HYH03_016488 [Edaphochlamys debaryana]|uniref:Uncharacterized protein n=1 Tax=Edaphochlamys debaryana TaxID=47281 RepID=A0A835XJ43_9CHLO|nr:hypothetical protein HYH03_016488 [Edaphochlamys debaryana]|eukprot:KAG2484741.1 hypothetical protein HYH03_016488 [Edaphochlamys debaryana]
MLSSLRTVLGVALLVVALASAPIGEAARRGLEEHKGEVADTADFPAYFGRKLMQGGPTCSFACSNLATCVTATCNYYNSTHNYVTVNMATCKSGTISSMTETWTEPSPALAPTTAAAAPASPASSQPPSPAAPEPPSPAAPEPPSAQPSPAPSSPPASQPPSAQPSLAPSSPATPQPAAPQPSPTPSSASAPEPPSPKPASAPSSPAASQPASSQPPSSPAAAPSSQPPAPQPAAAAPPPPPPPSPPPPSPPPPPPPSPPPVAPVGDNTATPPPSPPACANDTIWAAPRSTGEAQPGTTVPTFKFTTGSPAASSSPLFTWNPLQTIITDAGSDKWGGYFTITTPSSGQTFTTATTATTIAAGPFGCAGCAKNDPRRGWDVGGVIIQVRAVNATFVTASCSLLIRNNANVTAVVDQGHFYASYTPMPNFNPGQFPTATITGIPGAEGTNTTMTARVGGTKAANSSPIYLACHWGVAAC